MASSQSLLGEVPDMLVFASPTPLPYIGHYILLVMSLLFSLWNASHLLKQPVN
jgi:hypothetical protein